MGVLFVLSTSWLALDMFATSINREAYEAAERARPILARARFEPPRVIEHRLEQLRTPASLRLMLSTVTIRSMISIDPTGRAVATDRRRHDEDHDPEHRATVPTMFERIEAASELLAGLQEARSNFRNVVLQVSINPRAFERAMQLLAGFVCITIPFVVAVSCLIARRLTRTAMQPLQHVTDSLRRLESGDLKPLPLEQSGDIEFRELAVAYNGAVTRLSIAMNEQDRNQSQMRSFIADAGHQLKTPLTVVRGFVAVLLRADRINGVESRRILKTIAQHVLLMGSLIENMIILDAWERDIIESEPCEIRDAVCRIVEPLRAAWAERNIDLAGPEMFVEIDASDCRQIFTNVIENALKYTTGRVEITIEERSHMVRVTVSDAGPGMSAEECVHAFDRFYRGERRDVPGSGLGLAIAHRAVERAGGAIYLTSATSTGTTITVLLPKAHAFEEQGYAAKALG